MPSFTKDFVDKSCRKCLHQKHSSDEEFARCLIETSVLVGHLEQQPSIEREAFEVGEKRAKEQGAGSECFFLERRGW